MKKLLKIALPICMLISTNAFSQTKVAFNGFYTGLSLGYNQTSVNEGNVSWVSTADPTTYTAGNGQNSKSGGFIGGLNFGYDHRIGNYVIGGEISGSLPGGTANGYAATDDITPGLARPNQPLTSSTKLQTLFTIKPKIGFVIDNKTMIYGMAGLAMGSIKRTVTDVNPTLDYQSYWLNTGDSASNTKNQFGYILGAGAERMITEQLSIKLEFNYVDLGNPSFTYTGASGVGAATMTQNVKVTNMATTLGLSYKF
jgi:outer membrane immunogenic protein